MAIRRSQSKLWGLGGRGTGAATQNRLSATRNRKVEKLEDRVLMAVVGIQTNDGSLLNLAPGARNVSHVAPRDLTVTFAENDVINPATVSTLVRVTRAGFDNTLGNANDIVVAPGFIGIGDSPNTVVFRFSETLPDDLYRIQVVGAPQPGTLNVDLDLNLGAQIISVVPQPITRNAAGALTQATNQIDVYFNNDDLFATAIDSNSFPLSSPNLPSVIDPLYYQLIFTNNTATNLDNGPTHTPTFISYDPLLDKAVLTFAAPINQLSTGPGTYRLRIGTDEVAPQAPATVDVLSDPGSSFDTARNLVAQFDTSPVIRITSPGTGIVEGSTITITDDTSVARVFEFSVDTVLSGSGNLRIPYTAGSTAASIAQQLAAAINNSPLTTTAVASGDRVILNRDRNVLLSDSVRGVFIEQSQSLILNSEIKSPDFVLDYPGAISEPGHREISPQSHYTADPYTPAYPSDFADPNAGTQIFAYNFQDIYGTDPTGGGPLRNVITEAQKNRVREVFESFGHYFGLDFIETPNTGIIVATGDLRAVNPLVDTGRGGTLSISGGGLIVLDAAERWDDSFGLTSLVGHESYYREFMHELSFLLGFGPTTELPQITVSTTTPETYPTFGQEPEGVFPGDHDIVHGQHLYRPDSTDIDLYKFTLEDTGLFLAETTAERLSAANPNDSSLLDTYLRLYRETPDGGRELIAQNDDYFSQDSLIELNLSPGTYYVGVSSTGNESYDPTIPDSGIGGTSEGPYKLRMTFRPQADNAITDTDVRFIGTTPLADPQALDGDADGISGGVFNYWFRAMNPSDTLIVDSSAAAGGNGSLLSPYNELDVAFQNAGFGDVVRVVGNGGTDGNPATLADNDAVLIGVNPVTGQPLKDGTSVKVPKNVSLMVDAGAIFKFRRSSINVGSSAPQVDRADGSLQVLGTPTTPAYFTSYDDETIGKDTNPQISQTPQAGNWGGLVFRTDLDRSENRTNFIDYELNGIFLNHVNHADIRYGGGNVSVDSVERIFNSIDLTNTRPTISFNTITLSNFAAIAANPDSFLESNFNDPRTQNLNGAYTADYTRIGPDVHGNRLVANRLVGGVMERQQNTLNGLFIRIPTDAGRPLEQLTVTGRFNDTDIAHIISENLEIRGTPGGPTGTLLVTPANTPLVDALRLTARTDAQLKIDAGIVVKLDGSRIEVQQSAQLIAEAKDGLEAVFTSLLDTRFGGGGTFDTSSNSDTDGDGVIDNPPEEGDWGGIYAAPLSSLSLDRALIAYGGGSTTIPGGFASFNALEIHQAEARIANSVFEFNGDGTRDMNDSDDVQRAGRANNADAVIFIRGAQPIIVNNTIRNSISINGDDGQELPVPAISINANALNKDLVSDPGRMTGLANVDGTVGNEIDSIGRGNFGPFIRGNVLENNELNGLEVREAVLTTESVWDDTDIVHILQGEIIIPDFHTFGGLRLQSSAAESLVVKIDGATSGFTSIGRPLDIDDRIGGMLHVIGQPNHPVILTSLADDSVGAGLLRDGTLQVDTNNDGGTTSPAPGDWRGLLLDNYTHDRNVETVTERESVNAGAPGFNATADNAQFLGFLAEREFASDETLRLGFTVHGTLSEPHDLDVYSFTARPGTEVWFDIDRTSHTLDTVVELINSEGEVLARSDDSYRETLLLDPIFTTQNTVANRLQQTVFNPTDHWSTNPLDAGMRLILPGQLNGPELTYHVRVRSSSDNLDGALLGGQTSGVYQLQVRLREIDEFGGATVQFADINYATNGIHVEGGPTHSPLLGEAAEDATANDTRGQAQNIGNVLDTDRGTISVAGNLSAGNDVDWYQFEVAYQDPTLGGTYPSFVFDLDYADGLARANTFLAIYDATGELVFTSRDSNVGDDRSAPLSTGGDLTDLDRGSVGANDPMVGAIHLPEGNYFVAVSSNAGIPIDLEQFFLRNPNNPLLRAEPVDSLVRIVEDHISFSGGSTGFDPIVPNLFQYEYSLKVRNAEDIIDGETVYIVGTGIEFLQAGPSALFEFDDDGVLNNPNAVAISLVDFFGVPLSEEDLALEIVFAINAVPFPYNVFANVSFTDPTLVELGGATWIEQEEAPSSDYVGLRVMEPSTRPFTLQDVSLFVSSSGNRTRISTVDPFSGGVETVAGQFGITVGDIAMRHDGGLYAYTIDDQGVDAPKSADSGNFIKIDPGNASIQTLRDDGIETYEPDMNGQPVVSHNFQGNRIGDGIQFEATTFANIFGPGHPVLYAVGNRGLQFPGADYYTNILYVMDGSEFDNNGIAPGLPLSDPNLPRLGRAATDALDIGHIDTNLDAGGGTNSVVLSREATQVTSNMQGQIITNEIIRDKDGFMLQFIDGGTITPLFDMEFDSGPDAELNFDPADVTNPDAMFDGEFFTLTDGVGNVERFEFDTGPVLVIGNFQPGDAGSPDAGDQIRITDNTGQTRIFVIDDVTDTVTPPANQIPIQIDSRPILGTTAQQFQTAVLNAINGSPLNVNVVATNNGRITITGDTNVVLQGNPTFEAISLSGAAGIMNTAASDHRIPVEENMTPAEVRVQIDRVINGVTGSGTFPGVATVTVGIDGERLNFHMTDAAGMLNPLVVGDFSNVPSMNPVADTNGGAATGGVATGAVRIPFLAQDTEADVATLIADAVNNLPLAQRRFDLDGDGTYDIQVLAQNNGDSVTFIYQANPFGTPPSMNGAVEVVNPPGSPFLTGAPAPGGFVTGLAAVGGVLYAVSDNGGLYAIANPNTPVPVTNGDALIQADYINTAVDLLGLNFAGLTAGPPTVEGGKYADLLFGITTGGTMVAFNTQGELQPIFAGGATSIQTGVGGVSGLAFSTLDYNLWHTTGTRGTDPGHGLNAPVDDTRPDVLGGTSLWFGNELGLYSPTNVVGQETTNNYQFPGGSEGSIVSNEFSLAGYTGLDAPTLYFNYFLDTEDAASNPYAAPPIHMRDSLRVFVSTNADDNDNGDWHLIATNNAFRGPAANDDEYDWSALTGLPIQELFDNTGNWRQARIDLSTYAGNDNIRLRFDFSTAGGLNIGGTQVGTELNARAGSQLRDGQTVTIQDFDQGEVTFEFDLGYTLVPPSGGQIQDGETFQVTDLEGTPQVFEFDKDNFFSRNIVTVDGSQIVDGDTFVIRNGALEQAFEFESGYSLQIATDPATFGLVDLADGDFITVGNGQGGQVVFEFDTNGTVAPGATRVSIAGTSQIRVPIFGGGANGTADGHTFTITDGQGGVLGTFEFNSVGGLNNLNNIPVTITQTSTQNIVANAIVTAINGAGLGLVATNQGAGNVNVAGVPHVVETSGAPALTLTGTRTTPAIVADRLGYAILTSGLGLSPTNVGNGLLNVGGTTHVISVDDAPGVSIVGAPGLTDPQAVAVPYLNSIVQTPDEIAVAIANAINGASALGVSAVANGSLVELSGLLEDTEFSPGDTELLPELVIPTRITDATSAGNIATLIALLIEQSPLNIQARVDGNRVNLTGAVAVNQSFDTSLNRPGLFIDGAPGVALGNVAIPVHSDLNATEVAKQIAHIFNETLNPAADVAGYLITPNTDTRIQLLNGTILDPGPIGADGLLEGDFTPPLPFPIRVHAFPDSSPVYAGSLRGMDNNHQGAFIDDIIIGFAERGEMITGGNVSPGYRGNPASSVADIVTGEYQLEIRRASEYGIPGIGLALFRSFDTNDRFGEEVTLFAPSGDQVSPGSTFEINEVTFEYVDSTIREPSDILGNAQHTGITPTGQQRFLGFGRIGDNNGPAGDNNNPPQGLDVDLLQLELTAGDAVQFDIDALLNGDDLNTYLRIFDDSGVEVANSRVNNDAPTELTTFDPYILFFPPTTGTYYVGVSGVDTSFIRLPNDDYDPQVAGSGTNMATTNGTYQLEIIVNGAEEAFAGNVPVRYATFDNAATIANQITTAINSDLVQEDLVLGVTADSNLTSDRVNLHGPVIVVDDIIDSIPVDVPETNDTLETATDTGIAPGGPTRYHASGVIGDNPDFQHAPYNIAIDVDLFAVELAAGDIINVDLDARDMGSFALNLETTKLDTLLRVFQLDAAGNPIEIAAIDDAGAPGEYPFGYGFPASTISPFLDSYFGFVAPTDGVYYFGVSSWENVAYNPLIPGSGSGGTSGPYEITIEVGGATAHGITQQVFEEQGDDNQFRDQGQLILNGNRISDSANFAIFVDAGARDQGTGLPHPAPVRNFVEINDSRLAPGVVITNNIIFANQTGGIHYSGDPNPANQPLASVPFGRIVNNTIYGRAAGDVGIEIQDNASPTILNNIVANLGTGITVDASSSTTVIGATLYQNNGLNSNVFVGDFAIQLTPAEPLFVDAANENFYLRARSRAIDSALNSLEDRPALETVRDPIGIALSPVLAPNLDAFGQTRLDDFTFEPPDGFGADVFKDRGAIERADFAGPRAVFNEPRDNDAEGFDQNPQATIIETSGQPVTVFAIEFDDGVSPIDPGEGSGINPASVTPQTVVITFTPPNSTTSTTLQLNTDYTFSFDTVNGILNLTPVAGLWAPGTYNITLDNTPLGPVFDTIPPITDIAGNILQANQTDGTVRFRVAVADDLDFGDLPTNYTFTTPVGLPTVSYATTLSDNGPRHHTRPNFFLGSLVDTELDGRPSANAQGDDGQVSARDDEDGVKLKTILTAGGTPTITVTASSAGLLDAWFDYNRDGDFTDANEQIFVSRQLVAGTNTLQFTIPNGLAVGEIFSRFRFSSQGGLAPTGVALDGEVEDYRFTISPPGWQNQLNRFDVDGRGTVTTFDALLIVSALRSNNSQPVILPNPPAPPLSPPPFLDVNGDNRATISDALDVIREIIRQQEAGEGEGSSLVAASGASQAAEALNVDLGGSVNTIDVQTDDDLTEQVAAQIGEDSLISELTQAPRRQSVDDAFSNAADDEDEPLLDLAIDDIADDLAAEWANT